MANIHLTSIPIWRPLYFSLFLPLRLAKHLAPRLELQVYLLLLFYTSVGQKNLSTDAGLTWLPDGQAFTEADKMAPNRLLMALSHSLCKHLLNTSQWQTLTSGLGILLRITLKVLGFMGDQSQEWVVAITKKSVIFKHIFQILVKCR